MRRSGKAKKELTKEGERCRCVCDKAEGEEVGDPGIPFRWGTCDDSESDHCRHDVHDDDEVHDDDIGGGGHMQN